MFFDANSGAVTVTVSATANCANLDFTGFTGTFAGTSSLNVYGSFTLATGMTRTYTGTLTFKATTTGKTLTFNGKTTGSATVTFDGVGGGWTLQDAWDLSTSVSPTLTLTNGALDTNGQTVTTQNFIITGTATRTLTLGASVINLTSTWNATTTTGLTFNANTSSIRVSASATFAGGGLTYNEVQLNGSTMTVNQDNTFATLTRTGTAAKTDVFSLAGNQTVTGTLTINGDSAVNRMFVASNTVGTARTLTAATVSVTNADFRDITGAGAGSWNLAAITGGSGDCGGNTSITFTTAANQYWHVDAGSWSDSSKWFLATNGGGGAGRVPLPQDTAIFDTNSIDTASQTITQDMPRIGSVDFTSVANSPTFTTSTAAEVYGSLTLVSGMTLTASTQTYTFAGRGSHTLTSAGKSWGKALTLNAPGGTLTLQDALTMTTALTVTSGTFSANNQNVTATVFSSSNSNTRTVTMGSGTWTLTGTGTVWSMATTTGLTLNANTSTITINDASSTAKTFSGGGMTFNDILLTGAGTGTFNFVGSNTFADFECDTPPHTIQFTAGTTTTVTTFTVSGTSGNLMTIGSITAASHALAKSGAGSIQRDYLSVSRSDATPASTWFAGDNSTDGSNNTGWVFTAHPSRTRMLLGVG